MPKFKPTDIIRSRYDKSKRGVIVGVSTKSDLHYKMVWIDDPHFSKNFFKHSFQYIESCYELDKDAQI